MDKRVSELHCIMPIGNLASVVAHGILSYERAAKLAHRSVAMPAMQDRRDVKTVPGGLRLHQYANLYFHARNPMLSARRNEDVCVLRVSTAVLQVEATVITDQNAASKYVRFYAPSQLNLLNFDDIYARDWRHPDDQIREWQHKSCKCAEVLVPHRVQASLIMGAYVLDDAALTRVSQAGFTAPVSIDADFFFR
jgi:ssDNA thymidine ADP-ribosyltransferase, DarT